MFPCAPPPLLCRATGDAGGIDLSGVDPRTAALLSAYDNRGHNVSSLAGPLEVFGGVGPEDFYRRTVGAVPIEGSTPGIYDFSLVGR